MAGALESLGRAVSDLLESLMPVASRVSLMHSLMFPHIHGWRAMNRRVRYSIRRKYMRATGNDDYGTDFERWLQRQGVKPIEWR